MGSLDAADLTGAWDYSLLPPNVRVGVDCYLERRKSFERFRSSRDPGLVLGERVKVYTWTEFNIEPTGVVTVGDDSILVGCVIMCAEEVSIGCGVTISYHVTIADSDFHPIDPDSRVADAIAASPGGDVSTRPPYVSAPVTVGDGATVGIGALILKGVTIGEGGVVGPGAVVTGDVPPGKTVEGNPARVVEP